MLRQAQHEGMQAVYRLAKTLTLSLSKGELAEAPAIPSCFDKLSMRDWDSVRLAQTLTLSLSKGELAEASAIPSCFDKLSMRDWDSVRLANPHPELVEG